MVSRTGVLICCMLALAVTITAPAMQAQAKDAPKASNTLAVCGCGMVFVPNEKTEYVTYNGKSYACCTHECHEMAMKDPAATARMAEQNQAGVMSELTHLKLGVGNVIAVTEKGTKALCGCGKQFMVDETTEFLQYEGKSYACCSHGCHEMSKKDVAAAVASFKSQLAAMQ